MFPDRRVDAVAVEGNRGAGEVESAVLETGDDLDRVGAGEVFGGAEHLEGSHIDGGVGEGCEQRGDVFGAQERLVALDVDVEVGRVKLGDRVDAVGARGQIGACEDGRPVVSQAERHDLVRVGGDEDLVERGACAGGLVDPGEHGAAGDLAENLAGETGRAETGGNDGEGAGWSHRLYGSLTGVVVGLRIDKAMNRRSGPCLCVAWCGFFVLSLFTPWRCSSDG